MIKLQSPTQLKRFTEVLEIMDYDANTRISQAANGTIIASNRQGVTEIMTNGESRFRGS